MRLPMIVHEASDVSTWVLSLKLQSQYIVCFTQSLNTFLPKRWRKQVYPKSLIFLFVQWSIPSKPLPTQHSFSLLQPGADCVIQTLTASLNKQHNIEEDSKLHGDFAVNLKCNSAGITMYRACDFVFSLLRIYCANHLKWATTNATSKTAFLISGLQVSWKNEVFNCSEFLVCFNYFNHIIGENFWYVTHTFLVPLILSAKTSGLLYVFSWYL
jgi:hypothetical protein